MNSPLVVCRGRHLVPFLIFSILTAPLPADVVINEIMYHPQHADSTPEPFGEEFLDLHNTDPLDGTSRHRIDVITSLPGGDIQLQFAAQAGKIYTVQYSDTLLLGSWQFLTNVAADLRPGFAESLLPRERHLQP